MFKIIYPEIAPSINLTDRSLKFMIYLTNPVYDGFLYKAQNIKDDCGRYQDGTYQQSIVCNLKTQYLQYKDRLLNTIEEINAYNLLYDTMPFDGVKLERKFYGFCNNSQPRQKIFTKC